MDFACDASKRVSVVTRTMEVLVRTWQETPSPVGPFVFVMPQG